MDVKYRPMKEDDWKEIQGLYNEAWSVDSVIPKEALDKYCNAHCLFCYTHSTFCIVAEVEEKVVGFLMGRDNSQFKHNVELEQKVIQLRKELQQFKEPPILINSLTNYYKMADEIIKEQQVQSQNELVLFVVSEKQRGKGIGKGLITEVIELLKSNDQHDFYLTTDTSCNYKLYDHLGFKKHASKSFAFELPKGEVSIEIMVYTHRF